jgi:hypothetical protein
MASTGAYFPWPRGSVLPTSATITPGHRRHRATRDHPPLLGPAAARPGNSARDCARGESRPFEATEGIAPVTERLRASIGPRCGPGGRERRIRRAGSFRRGHRRRRNTTTMAIAIATTPVRLTPTAQSGTSPVPSLGGHAGPYSAGG